MVAPRPFGPPVHWRHLYEKAILEIDLTKIPERVNAAKKAIQTALNEVSSEGQNEECERLVGYLTVLDDLLKMYQRPQSA